MSGRGIFVLVAKSLITSMRRIHRADDVGAVGLIVPLDLIIGVLVAVRSPGRLHGRTGRLLADWRSQPAAALWLEPYPLSLPRLQAMIDGWFLSRSTLFITRSRNAPAYALVPANRVSIGERLDAGFVDHIEAIFVAKVRELRIVRVVGNADRVEIGSVSSSARSLGAGLSGDGFTVRIVVIVAIDALDRTRRPLIKGICAADVSTFRNPMRRTSRSTPEDVLSVISSVSRFSCSALQALTFGTEVTMRPGSALRSRRAARYRRENPWSRVASSRRACRWDREAHFEAAR